MAATFSHDAERLIINGNYKTFTSGAGNTTTLINVGSGDLPGVGDAGRFLLWKPDPENTGTWEIRFIEAATLSSVTVTDGGFSVAPEAGEEFVISTNLQDVVDGINDDTVIRQQGFTSYQLRDRDFALQNGAFLADVNKSFSTESTQTGNGFIPTYPMSPRTAIQFGRLIGGEANGSTETIGGCQLHLEFANNSLVFTNYNEARSNGPVINFYGCLIESVGNDNALPFIRSSGPCRIIGCIADGPLGGRLYSPRTELVSSRFSGNRAGGNAWSLGGTFVRPIEDAFFFQNDTAVKAFDRFAGTFSNTRFADSNDVIINNDGASNVLLFKFIDCTTWGDSQLSNIKGNYEQYKSVNYTIADGSGAVLDGAKVAIFDNAGEVQGDGVEESVAGVVAPINCRFYRRNHNAGSSIDLSPFSIRIRDYGFEYIDISSAVSEPIKQEVRLRPNAQTEATYAEIEATTGIDIDFATKTVTITSSHGTQSLYDYYQFALQEADNMQYAEEWVRSGDLLDIADWDMNINGAIYTGDVITTGLILLFNGAFFNGVRTDQNGTISPPVNIDLSGILPESRVQLYNLTTDTETMNTESGTGVAVALSNRQLNDYNPGDIVRLRVTKLGYEEWLGVTVVGDNSFSFLVNQREDDIYSSLGYDGSTITKFEADYTDQEVDMIIGSDWEMAELYAWWSYNLTTERGIREYFGGISAIDLANFRINVQIVDLYLDNTTNASYKQLDNRRFYRSTGNGYPVKEPTTSGYGLDVVWRNNILVSEQPGSGLTEEEAAQLKRASDNSILIPGLY